jgi:biopolymer transport protein ExbD
MNRTLLVSLIAVTLTLTASTLTDAQSAPMQRGISVQMVATQNATRESSADDPDAWIVTVTADGKLYFGINPVAPESLMEEMKVRPRLRDAKLYIKADARAPFASVERVLEAARVDLFTGAVLLTSQPGQAEPGTIVPPKGLDVLVGPAVPNGTVATVVELFSSGQQPLMLKINDDQIPWSALQGTLMQHFQKGDERVILLRADVHLPFADVVRVIDLCRAAGAQVVLPATTL